jgi:phage shock protein PspC (stress-responsive transcriptional regulator)
MILLLLILIIFNMTELQPAHKKLYRSRTNTMIAGVCGGIGEYLNIDATLVRIAFVVFSLFGGCGILLYFIMAIIVPLAPEQTP